MFIYIESLCMLFTEYVLHIFLFEENICLSSSNTGRQRGNGRNYRKKIQNCWHPADFYLVFKYENLIWRSLYSKHLLKGFTTLKLDQLWFSVSRRGHLMWEKFWNGLIENMSFFPFICLSLPIWSIQRLRDPEAQSLPICFQAQSLNLAFVSLTMLIKRVNIWSPSSSLWEEGMLF